MSDGVSNLNWWPYYLATYVTLALLTFVPVVIAAAKKIDLKHAKFSFSENPHFSDEAKVKLEQHYDRLQGTLVFWKNKAEMYGYFHHYSIGWTIFGGISLPFLAQAITPEAFSKWTLTVISAHVALILVSQKGFKVEQNYKNYRMGESEYYDVRRRLLDQPHRFGADEQSQIDAYFEMVESIRHDMRTREVDGIASFDEIDQRMRQRRDVEPSQN